MYKRMTDEREVPPSQGLSCALPQLQLEALGGARGVPAQTGGLWEDCFLCGLPGVSKPYGRRRRQWEALPLVPPRGAPNGQSEGT